MRRSPACLALTSTLVLGLTLPLAGCFANPLEALTERGAEQLVEQVIKDQTGENIDIGVGSGATIPDGWPGLPTPEAELISAVRIDKSFMLSYAATDEAQVTQLYDALLSNGFTEETSADLGSIKTSMLRGQDWTVSLSWFADDSTGGWSISYSVMPVDE